MFVTYAHRGASEYAPENTMNSFRMGIEMGANGIETDVRRTRDGVLVLFHDRTLKRVTGHDGAVSDFTYEELLQIPVIHSASGRADHIVLLEDFLRMSVDYEVQLAIELKDPDIEKEVFEMVRAYGLEKRSIITSFDLEYLAALKQRYPEAAAGYLTEDFDDAALAQMKQLGIGQLCPNGVNLSREKVEKWHGEGFSVRAWGIKDVEVMKHAFECGVDGMTVNFPDKLLSYIEEKEKEARK